MPINYYDLVTYLGLALLVIGVFLALTQSFRAAWVLAIASIPLSSEVLTGDRLGLEPDTMFFFPSDFWAPILTFFLVFTGLPFFKATFQTRLGRISLLYFFWMFIATLFSYDFVVSIKYFLLHLCYFLGYGILSYIYFREDLTTSVRVYTRYLWPFLGMVLFFCIVEHLLLGGAKHVVNEAIIPFFREHTVYGAFILWMLVAYGVLVWHRKLGIGGWSLVGALLVAWFLSYSRAAWLVAIVIVLGGWTFAWLSKQSPLFRLLVVGSLLLGSSAGLVYTINNATWIEDMFYKIGGDVGKMIASSTNLESNLSNLGRLHRWKIAIDQAIAHPFTGIGPNTFAEYYHHEKSKSPFWSIIRHVKEGFRFAGIHNEYLTAATEMGFVGFLLFGAIYFFSVYYPFRWIKQSSHQEARLIGLLIALPLLAYYLGGVVNNYMDHGKMAALVYLHWGMAMAVEWHLKQNAQKSNQVVFNSEN